MRDHLLLGHLLRQLHRHFPRFLARRTLEQGGSARRCYAALLGLRSSHICSSLYLYVADVGGVSLVFLSFCYYFPCSPMQFDSILVDGVHFLRRAFQVRQVVSVGEVSSCFWWVFLHRSHQRTRVILHCAHPLHERSRSTCRHDAARKRSDITYFIIHRKVHHSDEPS